MKKEKVFILFFGLIFVSLGFFLIKTNTHDSWKNTGFIFLIIGLPSLFKSIYSLAKIN